jgi:type III restriction enzyme
MKNAKLKLFRISRANGRITMLEHQTFKNQDLVLKVSPNYDPKKFDQNRYEPFLDALCGDREYQKEAIRITLRYFLGGEYSSLNDLAEQNYYQNAKLQEKYSSLNDFKESLQLPDQLSCSLDHATATGKSYVMYGIARIMLAEGAVDQVLVLCPSTTIESGLSGKFRILSSDKTFKDLLGDCPETLIPRIINASSTIQKGDICVENIHATYFNTKSAIEDSLVGKGVRTLILNDEAHHLMNPSDVKLKKWKEFLIDPKYGFKFIVNVSGTCYIGNEYFTEVIHRYSLRDAIDAKFVKSIDYVVEDTSVSEDEKFQKIYANHVDNKKKKSKIKPLTIFVTKDINACERLAGKLEDFLVKKEKISVQEANDKVLIVTSSPKHKRSIPTLARVDDKENTIEWITSVSMLSEGWDVKNVFQIVPHEERAFNSKLLIAQVLGRGLRIPDTYRGNQPRVIVFNHDKWSSSIKHLVDDILEIEKNISSYVVSKNEDFNFTLYNIEYERNDEKVDFPQEVPYELLKKGYITYSSQAEILEKRTTYETAISGKRVVKKTLIEYEMYPVEEVAKDIRNRLLLFDNESDSKYSEEFTEEKIIKILNASLEKVTDITGQIGEENRSQSFAAFGVIRRKGAQNIRLNIEVKDLYTISTKDIKSSIGLGDLRRDRSVFYDDFSLKLGDKKHVLFLTEITQDESFLVYSFKKISNTFNFKTPLNIVLTAFKPERAFVSELTSEDNAKSIDSWVKSPDMGFYSIEYSWRKGEHPKRGSFNPDFFIKIGSDIIVVEIKDDKDISDENRAKLKYANEHFTRLNRLQKEQIYYFNFLSPRSYPNFFQAIREKAYQKFKSELEAKLERD